MSAVSRRPKASITDIDTPNLPTSTAPTSISTPGHLRLDETRVHLAAAADALDGWYARHTGEGHTYVADGHEAIRLIEAATWEIYRVRAALIGELRADEDERAVRVDRMIAEFRACRASDIPGDCERPWSGGAA